ncbi:MAG TPA: endoglucanase [Treponema sp.]|nr:endoglucanase [Treponema sp.]
MKRTLTAAAVFLFSALCLFGCRGKEEPSTNGIEFSKHRKIPKTDSVIVTKPQEMNAALTALELTKLMGNGINIGNTHEAYREKGMSTKEDPTVYERLWGQPVTTKALLDSYKAAGFDCVRIPIAWTNAMDYEHGDYVINTPMLDRIETVVNYALDAGLYVIINDHWDGDWWGMFGSKTERTRNDAMELYKAMWTQIANRFKHYSDHLIFEGGNEEIGNRLNDVYACSDSGFLSEDDCYRISTVINQAFVDVVRGTGSNNKNRFLLIPGYGTDISATCDERFVMPKDTAASKLLISVHYYTPWGFCGGPSVGKWGNKKETAEMNRFLKMMTKFTDAGYGVIIGEYATAAKSDGSKKDEYAIHWTNQFLDNCDYYNYCPLLWDCNTFYKKDINGFDDPDFRNLYFERRYAAQTSDPTGNAVVSARFEDAEKNAPDSLTDGAKIADAGGSVAWIMYNSLDYGVTYSVGDVYNPDSKTEGLVAVDSEITGPGTYTVELDFTGTEAGFARSFAFSAIGISNGEVNFPGYCIKITEFKVNGQPYRLASTGYTNADDGICTRMNLINEWVKDPPPEARSADGNMKRKRPTIINKDDMALQEMKTLSITFEYGPARQ